MRTKLNLIFYPYLKIAGAFIVGYCILYWLFFIKLEWLHFDDDIAGLWLPLALPWIPVLLWLRPGVRMMRYKNDNAPFGIMFLIAIFIAVPAILAKKYTDTATGVMTITSNVDSVALRPATKYYDLKRFYIDKNNASIHSTATTSGKHNETLHYNIYVAVPVYNEAADTSRGSCRHFLGISFTDQLSNSSSDEEKHRTYQSLAEHSQREFDTTDYSRFTYLEHPVNTEAHRGMIAAAKKNTLLKGLTPFIFIARDKPFAERNGNTLIWVFLSFLIASVVLLIILSFIRLDEDKLNARKTITGTDKDDLKETLRYLIPSGGHYITSLIIDINILVFLGMVFSGLGFISFQAADLLQWGGNFRPYTNNGEWWRLVTNIFLHGGLMHIVFNMFALVFVGMILEPLLGRTRYALIYLGTGIMASLASVWWHEATVSIGASGAIFGLFGFFLALMLLKAINAVISKAFLGTTLFFVGFNLLMGLIGGIDNAAHIGGLLSGFILGLLMSGVIKREVTEREGLSG